MGRHVDYTCRANTKQSKTEAVRKEVVMTKYEMVAKLEMALNGKFNSADVQSVIDALNEEIRADANKSLGSAQKNLLKVCKNVLDESVLEVAKKIADIDNMKYKIGDKNQNPTYGKVQTVDVGYYLKPYCNRVIENVYQGVDNGKLFFTTADGFNQYILPKNAIEWIVPHVG